MCLLFVLFNSLELITMITGKEMIFTPELAHTVCANFLEIDVSKAQTELDLKLGDIESALKESRDWLKILDSKK